MDQVLISLNTSLPCRQNEIQKLFNLFAYKDDPYVPNVFVCGGPSTGKSVTVTTVLEKISVKYCVVNLIECYSNKILFETILNKLHNHTLDPKNPVPVVKCDIVMDFIYHLQVDLPKINEKNFVIVLDKAEELRNMSSNLFGIFFKLKELSKQPVTVIFISEVVFENFFNQTIIPVKIFFPQYSRSDLLTILSLDEDNVKYLLAHHYQKEINFSLEFYQNYLNLFLSLFYRTTRNLSELRRMSRINFLKYCEPVAYGINKMENSVALWRNISSVLKNSLEELHVQVDTEKLSQTKSHNQDMVAVLELPYYAKFLLIAAYLASYNSTKEDKRLFMKFHGKKKATTKTKIQRKIVKELNVQLGPSPFTLDRLLAIFYSIIDHKVGFNNNLLVQVSSLVELKFLLTVSDNTTIDSQKYKCNLTFDFIQEISKMMGFNIRKYLYDY